MAVEREPQMANLQEIETAVEALPEEEYTRFRAWFLEQDWQKWDRQIESDSASGKLDFLVQEAHDAKDAGKLRSL
jgi:hypothetical protein